MSTLRIRSGQPRGAVIHRFVAAKAANHYGLVEDAVAIREGNANLCLSVSVDTVERVANLPEIETVAGLDAVTSGLTSDLVASAGIPGQYDHPRVRELERRVGDAFEAEGKPRPR